MNDQHLSTNAGDSIPAEGRCRKCGGEMRPGKATGQTWKPGIPDFPGQTDLRGQTMHVGGPGKLIDAMKCVDCGWSVSVESGRE